MHHTALTPASPGPALHVMLALGPKLLVVPTLGDLGSMLKVAETPAGLGWVPHAAWALEWPNQALHMLDMTYGRRGEGKRMVHGPELALRASSMPFIQPMDQFMWGQVNLTELYRDIIKQKVKPE